MLQEILYLTYSVCCNFCLFCFRKNKVRLLKADWTSYLYSCPGDTPEVVTNDKNEFQEGEFILPEGADSVWTVRRKPSYAQDVSSPICLPVTPFSLLLLCLA